MANAATRRLHRVDAARDRYARVMAAERAAYVAEQAAIIRAEREAKAAAALDALLDEIQG